MSKCAHCDRLVFAKGLCSAHYAKQRKYGNALEPSHRPEKGVCDVDGCGRPHLALGLCCAHYCKLKKTGIRGGPLRRSRTKLERYCSFVERQGDGDCWPWTGSVNRDGYGMFANEIAHRYGFGQFVRPLKPGESVDHTCHNCTDCRRGRACEHRRCQNPAHWEATADVWENGRRGKSITAENARKTHCKWGHELTPENSYGYKGKRQCKTCARLASRGEHPRQLAHPA